MYFLLSLFHSVFLISFEAKKDRKKEQVAKTEQCKDFADLCDRAEQLGTATGQEKDMLSVIVDMKNLVILDQKVRAMEICLGRTKKRDVNFLAEQSRTHSVKSVVKFLLPFAESGSLERACAVPLCILKDQGRTDDQKAADAVASRVRAVQGAELRVTQSLAMIVEAVDALQTTLAASFDNLPKYKPGDAASEAMSCVPRCVFVSIIWDCMFPLFAFGLQTPHRGNSAFFYIRIRLL